MTQEPTETPRIGVTRTELVWPGKYDEDGMLNELRRANLPFQVIERVNETRATREARKKPQELSLFDVWEGDEGETFDDGWRNKLIWGDNLLVMSSLLEKFAGKVDLIYIDPPFQSEDDYSFVTEIGEDRDPLEKQQSLIEEKAYGDTWRNGIESYVEMMYPRMRMMQELLSNKGSLYLHCDKRVDSYLRLLIDEIFGPGRFEAAITWKSSPGHSDSSYFSEMQNTILFSTKTHDPTWNQTYQPYTEEYLAQHYQKRARDGRRFEDDNLTAYGLKGGGYEYEWNGVTKLWRLPIESMKRLEEEDRIYYTRTGTARYKRYLDEMPGSPVSDLWTDIPRLNSQSLERAGYSTQKPEALLERIVTASSDPGDLVADFFCGSGTTMTVAEKLGRRWIGCDLGRWAIHVSRKRLLEIEGGQPFEVLNLGQYERQYWQSAAFGQGRTVTDEMIFDYLAFILRLYGAEPVSGLAHIHGKKDKAMVHVGSVDAPVTIDEVMDSLNECTELKQAELHVLGWEWEMGLNNLMVAEAKKRGVKLIPLQIPREVMEQQAVDKGDIQFFELAHLEATLMAEGREAMVALNDFVIPNTELIPDDVRRKVQRWSDYIDYWAIDWDFREDTFMQGWVTYRTRKDRKLDLVSDPRVYEEAGSYTVVVKLIDIFGNDTSQAYRIEVE